MNRYAQLCAAGTLVALSAPALSQQSAFEDEALRWHLNAGPAFTSGDAGDFFDDGFGLGVGLRWKPDPAFPVALRTDLRYLGFDASEDVVQLGDFGDVPAQITGGDASILGLNVGGQFDFDIGERADAYVTAGVGPYRRELELTQTLLFETFACDPFLGLCFDALTPGEVAVADTDTTRLGWSAAFGVQWPLERAAVFLEARYLRIETEEPTELIPVQFGVRF